MNKLCVKSVAFAGGVLWGASVLVVSIANWIWPDYGWAFLDLVSSVYPGYDAVPSIGSVAVGTLYGVLDGAVCGAIFALLYNFCAGRKKS